MNQAGSVAASVRQRLKNVAATSFEDFQAILTRYALERFLYRLSQSEYRERFILKGALLFSIWSEQPHRATRDLDLLGFGNNTLPELERVFREICRVAVELDGLEFNPETVSCYRIKPDQEYEGVRINLRGNLAYSRTRIDLQVDVGFGDAVFPAPINLQFPTILDFPAPEIPTYPRETVVAEKFQAMVMLGIAIAQFPQYSPGRSFFLTVTLPTFLPDILNNSSPENSKPSKSAICATSSAVDEASTSFLSAGSDCIFFKNASS